MANEQNLKPPINKRSTKEQREIRHKAGVKSGEARRAKKTMREMLDYLLEKQTKTNKGEMSTLEAMMVSMIAKAIKGDVRATEFIRDTIGQKPADKSQFVDGEGNNINPFAEFYKAVCNKKDYTPEK